MCYDSASEEDGEWGKVAATFPHLFTAYERKCADEALRNTEPDAYESVNGVVLLPRQSRAKDARRFQSSHATEWVVISAISSSINPGFVEGVAARGDDRAATKRWRFLVPSSEHEPEPFGFVIDETRHRPSCPKPSWSASTT